MIKKAPKRARAVALESPPVALDPRPWEATAVDPEQWRRLVYELHLHQVELETQNEELRLARVEMEAGLERAGALFDFAPIGYALLTLEGSIREINHAGARILGEDRAHLARRPFRTFLTLKDRPAFESLVGRVLDRQLEPSGEVATAGNHGASHLRLKASLLSRPERMILLAFEDITVERAREDKLLLTERALREADRHKSDFLSALSHELRNPLGPIRTGLDVLERAVPGNERSAQTQKMVKRQVAHLTRLVDDLLDVTRISRGKVRLERVVLDAVELLTQTVSDHRETFAAHRIELTSHLEVGPCWIEADPTRIVQAVSNVLGNAMKFTDPGGRVALELRTKGEALVLAVSDSGAGIAPEMIEQVFQPFVQAPQSIDRTRGGLGLGLPMTKGLIELHGGDVHIASPRVGLGTTVTIVLPLVPGPERVVNATIATQESHSRRQVLVIDDNVDAAEILQEALRAAGHAVRVAQDGQAGLAAARDEFPEVILCDIGLPGMDGYEVARTLRRDAQLREVFLVALTGYGAAEDRQLALEAGFDLHVTKPPDVDELERLIARDHRRA